MSHALVGTSSVALVIAAAPPPYGRMSYATTGRLVVRWKALPIDVPCVAESAAVMAGVMGHVTAPAEPVGFGACARKTMATCPAGSWLSGIGW